MRKQKKKNKVRFSFWVVLQEEGIKLYNHILNLIERLLGCLKVYEVSVVVNYNYVHFFMKRTFEETL
ncbi:hypothetical protein ABID30_002196 [Enterococcus rotai]